jgi:hypothetical protein
VIASPVSSTSDNNWVFQNNGGFYQYQDKSNKAGSTIYYRLKVTGSSSVYYSDVVAVNTGAMNRVMVYPNPSEGYFQLTIPYDPMGADLVITDVSGRRIRSWNAVQQRRVDVSDLIPGLYLLQIRLIGNGEMITERIIIR